MPTTPDDAARRAVEAVPGDSPALHACRVAVAHVLALPPGPALNRWQQNLAFTTLRGHHYVPSTRNHHWNRVRAAVGLGNAALYECTRHYFAWYLLNVMELRDHVVAAQLRHDDGGTLVRELYGHPDAAIARERIRASFREHAPAVALPSRPEARSKAS